ncbi:hypothetical protein HBH99_256530 [Parastagonospora nodorum]|nr:hypothetical protein HBI00_251650 [Parastagonospora nodorum]KAH4357884.1 hypothetical protein HBH99_256530 [Parastagonospora nodorum]
MLSPFGVRQVGVPTESVVMTRVSASTVMAYHGLHSVSLFPQRASIYFQLIHGIEHLFLVFRNPASRTAIIDEHKPFDLDYHAVRKALWEDSVLLLALLSQVATAEAVDFIARVDRLELSELKKALKL